MHICLSHYVICAPLFANQTVLRQCGKRDIQSVERRKKEEGREKKCAPGQPELAHLSLRVGVGGREGGGGVTTTGDMQAVVSKYVTARRGRAVVLLDS